jgi:hypothetical protein
MRRRPIANYIDPRAPKSLASPPAVNVPTVPTSQGDAIEPFITGGGTTFYPTGYPDDSESGEYPPEPGGVQLVCSQYVPPGRAAWIKQIEIAPCVPPILADPWRGWAGAFNFFEAGADPWGSAQRAASQAGLWETPLAWEGYFDAALPVSRPVWRWSLTLFPGNVAAERKRRNVGAFDPTDPTTWYLAPDMPVPIQTYGGSLPGAAVQGYVGAQRFQAVPGCPLPVHILCPENSTICLWARWTQQTLNPILAYGANGPLQPWEPSAAVGAVYPILPSIGRMVGYMQAMSRPAAAENAAYGWGG